jgi:hypothetical protein
MKSHNAEGVAGLVERRVCRRTGRPMGLYMAAEAGIEDDPQAPWAAVCEDHGAVLLTETQRLARSAMSYPEWCEECSYDL